MVYYLGIETEEGNKMKHKHYDLIVAKAANMDLVVFCKGVNDGCEWHEVKRFPNWQTNASYFLCLPQHKDACLHWLNGGEVQGEDPNRPNYFDDYANFVDRKNWSCTAWYMRKDRNIRIKPKKEKRWIGTCKNFVTSLNYPSVDECRDAVGDDTSWQFHEIEVEV